MTDRDAFPAVRVFILGQEVSEDVLSVNIALSDNARAPGTCEIVLASPGDRYVVTPDDILLLNPSVTPEDLPVPITLDRSVIDAINAGAHPFHMHALPSPSSQATLGWSGSVGAAFAQQAIEARARADVAQTAAALASEIGTYRKTTAAAVDRLDNIITQNIKNKVQDPIKQRVLLAKTGAGTRATVSQPEAGSTAPETVTPSKLAWLRGEASFFPFSAGDTIWHSNDPVRVFLRDPFRPTVWYHAFSGFVAGGGERNDANNQQVVTVRCEDVLRILRYARFTTSPGILDINALKTIQDGASLTFQADNFADLTLVEFVWTMIFGSDVAHTTEKAGLAKGLPGALVMRPRFGVHGHTIVKDASPNGVSAFDASRSRMVLWGPPAKDPRVVVLVDKYPTCDTKGDLSLYLALVDHQVRPSDIETMILSDYEAERADPDSPAFPKDLQGGASVEEVVRTIGEHPELYPVDGGRVFVLVPSMLTPSHAENHVVAFDVKGPELHTQWSTRLARLYEMLERVDFVIHASPRGDVLVEMPLYAFDPDDFGDTPVDPGSLRAAGINVGPEETRGPYGPHYRITREDTVGWDRNLNDEQVRTVWTSYYHLVKYITGAGTSAHVGPPAVEVLQALLPSFGARAEETPPTVYISSPDAAKYFCDVKLGQANANARDVRLEIMPNLALIPNRPVLQLERQTIATCRRVTTSLTWGEAGSMDTQLALNFVRAWGGQMSKRLGADRKPRRVYEALGGLAADPINYAALFADPGVPSLAPASQPAAQTFAPVGEIA